MTSHVSGLCVHVLAQAMTDYLICTRHVLALPLLCRLQLAMYVVRCIQNGSEKYKNMSKSRKEKKEQKEQSWEEQITVFVEDTAMADSMRQILRELLGMGWVVPFSVVCGILAGIQSLWKQEAEPGNPSAGFVCGPLNLQNDTGLKYATACTPCILRPRPWIAPWRVALRRRARARFVFGLQVCGDATVVPDPFPLQSAVRSSCNGEDETPLLTLPSACRVGDHSSALLPVPRCFLFVHGQARGHIEGTVSALKIIAVHVRGMGQPHIDQWVKKEHLRVQLSHRLVYVYAMLVFTLRGNGQVPQVSCRLWSRLQNACVCTFGTNRLNHQLVCRMPKSKQALAQIDRLRDKKSKDSLIGFDKTIVSQLKWCALITKCAERIFAVHGGNLHAQLKLWTIAYLAVTRNNALMQCSALLEETALLDTDFQDLVDANLINGSPAQVRQFS